MNAQRPIQPVCPIGDPPRLDYISKHKIRVDENYQRPLKPKRVQKIRAGFDWKQFGSLMLVDHGDDDYTVYDGQHRHAAVMGIDEIDLVPCVITDLDAEYEEAQAFLGVNINRSAISTVEKYWAGLEAGDEAMMRVCAVLDEAGCEVVPAGSQSLAPNRTKAIAAIQRALSSYGDEAVTLACKTLLTAWPKDTQALNGTIIHALARLYHNNAGVLQLDRMATKLTGKDRRILTADAEMMRKMGGGDAPLACAKALVEVYNRGLSTNTIQIGVRP